jgi:hypothetical protein
MVSMSPDELRAALHAARRGSPGSRLNLHKVISAEMEGVPYDAYGDGWDYKPLVPARLVAVLKEKASATGR